MKRSYSNTENISYKNEEKCLPEGNGVLNKLKHYFNSKYSVNLVERNLSPEDFQLVNPNKSAKHYNPDDLINLAKDIQQANDMIAATTCGKLKLISDQIKRLQKEAIQIMHTGLNDANLHRVSCNFKKIPGTVYHLYERNSGQKYFSMLSPEDWNYNQPHKFLGSFQLNHDSSWLPLDKSNSMNNAELVNYNNINKYASLITDSQSSLQNVISANDSFQ